MKKKIKILKTNIIFLFNRVGNNYKIKRVKQDFINKKIYLLLFYK